MSLEQINAEAHTPKEFYRSAKITSAPYLKSGSGFSRIFRNGVKRTKKCRIKNRTQVSELAVTMFCDATSTMTPTYYGRSA
jgi:hypothetical protein